MTLVPRMISIFAIVIAIVMYGSKYSQGAEVNCGATKSIALKFSPANSTFLLMSIVKFDEEYCEPVDPKNSNIGIEFLDKGKSVVLKKNNFLNTNLYFDDIGKNNQKNDGSLQGGRLPATSVSFILKYPINASNHGIQTLRFVNKSTGQPLGTVELNQ